MIFRLYTVYNNHEMMKTDSQTTENNKYYRKCSNNFAADCTVLSTVTLELLQKLAALQSCHRNSQNFRANAETHCSLELLQRHTALESTFKDSLHFKAIQKLTLMNYMNHWQLKREKKNHISNPNNNPIFLNNRFIDIFKLYGFIKYQLCLHEKQLIL